MRGIARAAAGAFALATASASLFGMFGFGAADAATHRVPVVRVFADGPRAGIKPIDPNAAPNASSGMSLHSSSVPGAVATHPRVYLVFWGKQWSNDPAHARFPLTSFFTHLYGSSEQWGTILTQYCQGLKVGTKQCGSAGQHVVHPTSSPLGGVWVDHAANAPSTASKSQIAGEAARAATHFGNTTQSRNVNSIYVIASPHGTHPDHFPSSHFCGWHSVVNTSAGMIPYTNLPYVPDLGAGSCTSVSHATTLDGYFSTTSHEYAESVTDLWLGRGWYDGSGNEIADVCTRLDSREWLGGVKYDVQGVWSNRTMRCQV